MLLESLQTVLYVCVLKRMGEKDYPPPLSFFLFLNGAIKVKKGGGEEKKGWDDPWAGVPIHLGGRGKKRHVVKARSGHKMRNGDRPPSLVASFGSPCIAKKYKHYFF